MKFFGLTDSFGKGTGANKKFFKKYDFQNTNNSKAIKYSALY